MARFRGRHSLAMELEQPRECQLTFADRLAGLARRAEVSDPVEPARAVFFIVLALMGLGLMLQVSHASTTVPRTEFGAEVRRLVQFRVLGLLTLLLAYRTGLRRAERFVPVLTATVIVMLLAVYLPVVHEQLNGSRRWLKLPLIPFTVQPSELARVVAVLWVARRCVMLGTQVEDARRGYLPMLAFGLALFVMILFEPDVGGSLLFILCFVSTMWVGGARRAHVAGSMAAIGGLGLMFGASAFAYVRERIDVWLGYSTNDQVTRAAEAMASGNLFGVGLTHGGFRNQSLQYMQSDYAFSLVGEELGFVGLVLVIGLFLGYLFHSLRLVSSLRNQFSALAAFGLLVSVAFQAMLHLQVVTGLAPPKGINLPFISEGGSALIASCLAVGLALGAVRRPVRGRSAG